MAEVLALVAYIVEVASFGLRLSRTLRNYGSWIVSAERRMNGLDMDVDIMSRVIVLSAKRLRRIAMAFPTSTYEIDSRSS